MVFFANLFCTKKKYPYAKLIPYVPHTRESRLRYDNDFIVIFRIRQINRKPKGIEWRVYKNNFVINACGKRKIELPTALKCFSFAFRTHNNRPYGKINLGPRLACGRQSGLVRERRTDDKLLWEREISLGRTWTVKRYYPYTHVSVYTDALYTCTWHGVAFADIVSSVRKQQPCEMARQAGEMKCNLPLRGGVKNPLTTNWRRR